MDSPVRKMQKRNDYNRHKLLRKIKRRNKARAEQESKIAEKELKRRLRWTAPKFDDGKNPILQFIRDRLYKNINPSTSYDNPISRIVNAVVLNNKDYQGFRDKYADAAWAKYLGYDQNLIKESKYKPMIGNNSSKYYTYDDLILNHNVDPVLGKNFTDDNNREFINAAVLLPYGKTAIGNNPPVLNNFTYSHGLDPVNGEYISVYDKYDLNPFGGSNSKDSSYGVGLPFEFYDRLYLHDYYGIPKNQIIQDKDSYYGGFLPEILVTNKK